MNERPKRHAFLIEAAAVLYYLGPLVACAVASLAFEGATRWVIFGIGFLWVCGNIAVGLFQGCD